MRSSDEDFQRCCLLLACLATRRGAPLSQVARVLGVAEGEVLGLIDQIDEGLLRRPEDDERLDREVADEPGDAEDDVRPPWEAGLGDRLNFVLEGDLVSLLIRPRAFRRPFQLSRPEAQAVCTALDGFARSGDSHYTSLAAELLQRLQALLRPDVAAGVKNLAPRLALDQGQADELAQLAVVSEGLRLKRAVDIVYYTASRDELGRRRIRPYAILNDGGIQYVQAHDEASGELRVFRLDRIRQAELSDREFRRPTDFDSGRLRRLGPYQSGQAERHARVRFHPPAARLVREEWDPGHLEDGPGGTVVARLDFVHVQGLVNYLLSFGGAAEVLEPQDLREELIRRARAMLGQTR